MINLRQRKRREDFAKGKIRTAKLMTFISKIGRKGSKVKR